MEAFLGLGLSTWLVGAVIAIAIYYWHKTIYNHYWKTKNVPSDGPGLTFGLSSLMFKGKTMYEMDEVQYKKHGKLYGAYFGKSPIMMVAEPELLRMIFVKDFQSFPDRRKFSTGNNILSKVLPFLDGNEWKRMRSIVSPIFTSGKMRKVSSLITKSAKTITESFLKHADSKTNVELKRLFGGYTLDVIASTAFGTELDSIKNPDNKFVTYARKVHFGINWRLILFLLAPKLMNKLGIALMDREVMSFFADLVLKIREQRMEAGGKVHDDFLQMLMDIESATAEEKEEHDETYFGSTEGETKFAGHENFKKTLSRDELIAQCVMFFLVGFDTTGTTLSIIAYLLALNQKCQERLHKEVDEIWEKHQGNLDYDVVNSMKYLDAVLAEALRVYPNGVRLERKCTQDYELGNTGITIQKGMFVGIPVYAMHRDPEFFPDPEIFNPERFLPENKDSIKPYTYLPFGSGPRNCVGMRFAIMEIKLCLVDVLRHVTFHTCAETEIPLQLSNGAGFLPKTVTVRVERRR